MGTPTSLPTERRIVLINQSQSKPPNSWDKIEQIGRIVSLAAIPIAIPIALAIYGSITQNALQKQTISRDYVQIAVSILKEREVDPALRGWAADLLAADSPTKIPDELQAKLRGGEVYLPNLSDMVGPQDLYTISPDRTRMAVVSLSSPGKVKVFDLTTKQQIAAQSFMSNGDRIAAMAFSPDSNLLAAVSLGGASVLDLKMSGHGMGAVHAMHDPRSISVSNDGQLSILDGTSLLTWDKERKFHQEEFQLHQSNVNQQP